MKFILFKFLSISDRVLAQVKFIWCCLKNFVQDFYFIARGWRIRQHFILNLFRIASLAVFSRINLHAFTLVACNVKRKKEGSRESFAQSSRTTPPRTRMALQLIVSRPLRFRYPLVSRYSHLPLLFSDIFLRSIFIFNCIN